MIERADADADGEVTPEDFYNVSVARVSALPYFCVAQMHPHAPPCNSSSASLAGDARDVCEPARFTCFPCWCFSRVSLLLATLMQIMTKKTFT